MIQPINLDIKCRRCGGRLPISQKELGILEIGLCRVCVTAKVVRIIRAKKLDFEATYDLIEADLLRDEPPV